MEFCEPDLKCSLVLVEGEDGWYVTSPVEQEYLTWSSKGKLFTSNLALSVGYDLYRLKTLKAP